MARRTMLVMAAAIVAIAVGASPGYATAAPPPAFTQFPQDGSSGSGADQLGIPWGVASDPTSGHVYVTERSGNRVSEFTAWGEFVKAWGWGVADGAAEPQICTLASGCGQGLEGSGAGQLTDPKGVAVDAMGAIYVVDSGNLRVQKFSPSGEFVLMFGGQVDKTTNASVCTKVSGDECGAGTAGSAPGQFGSMGDGDYIDVGPDGTIFVGDQNRIQAFNADGTFKSEVPLPQERGTRALAIEQKTGDIYVALDQSFVIESPEVPVFYKLNPSTGKVLREIEVGDPAAQPFPIFGFALSLATDSEGSVYAVAGQKQTNKPNWQEIVKFDENGNCLICTGERFAEPKDPSSLGALASSAACEVPSDILYVTHFGSGKGYIRGYGASPDPTVCPPPPVPPEITGQFAETVDTATALLRAQINPRFWDDTSYYLEYGEDECSKGGCAAAPASPARLGGKPVNFPVTSSAVVVSGLQPDTTYHFRFVAQSSGGGPVKGIGGKVGADGGESTFTTFPPAEARPSCPGNQEFRTGASAFLPDCRAYEMVSPLDKDSGDIFVLRTINAYPAGLTQSSLDGNQLTYSSYRAFGDPESAPWSSQYLATRVGGVGWSSKGLSAPREGESFFNTAGQDVPYKLFSPDLCRSWFLQDSEPLLDPAAPAGYAGLYRQDNCGGEGYRAIVTTEAPITAPNTKPDAFMPELLGVAAGGDCAVFRANGKLSTDASDKLSSGAAIYQLYESCGGELHLVSILPDGSASELDSSAGSASGTLLNHREHSVWHAVSEDGSRIYWSAATTFRAAPGKLYVRENADQDQSLVAGGECTESDKACTYSVSGTRDAQFWGAASDGSTALYTVGGDLYEFNFENRASSLIAEEVAGLLGAGDNASRAYFVSKEALDAGATAGELNLYLYKRDGEGSDVLTFVATLSPGDLSQELSSFDKRPARRTSRVSADGNQVAFMSSSRELSELTSDYDNTDARSGEPDAEVYLFNAEANGGAGALACVSCNPTGARPTGRELAPLGLPSGVWAAAQLPTWENQLYAEHALAEDGSRLFFESFEALELRDTNGKQDVYQWEAEGRGDCDSGDATFQASSAGCISLISSGASPQDSEFADATRNGSDVFFTTGSSLVRQDYGLVDVYDAREGGGLPSPADPRAQCEGEACQNPPPPPLDGSPASSVFHGAGNPRPTRCAAGKRRVVRHGKVHCVRKHAKHRKRQQGKAGR